MRPGLKVGCHELRTTIRFDSVTDCNALSAGQIAVPKSPPLRNNRVDFGPIPVRFAFVVGGHSGQTGRSPLFSRQADFKAGLAFGLPAFGRYFVFFVTSPTVRGAPEPVLW